MGSSLNVVGKYINNDFYKIYLNAIPITNLSSYCQKLLLIISGLLPIKKRIITSILKRLIPKEYRQSKLVPRDSLTITVQDFRFVDIRYIFTSRAEDGLTKCGQVEFRNWNLVADATQTVGSRLLKRSIDSHPNDCNAFASFYGVTGKTTKSIQGF
jgi:hypothetical protein